MTMVENGKSDEIETPDEKVLTDEQAAEIAKRSQYGQSGDMLDTTIGNMGGAGASATGPDIAKQSEPLPGNHGDLAAGSR